MGQYQDAYTPPIVEIPAFVDARVVLTDVPCNASVYVGALVYMNGSGVAINAIATGLTTSNIMGIVESKPSLEQCDIRVLGVTTSIFYGLDVTKEYFLSDTNEGEMQNVPPTASGSVMLKIGQPYSSDQMLVLKGTRTVRL